MSLARPFQNPMPRVQPSADVCIDDSSLQQVADPAAPGLICASPASCNDFPVEEHSMITWHIRRLVYCSAARRDAHVNSRTHRKRLCKCWAANGISSSIKVKLVNSLSGDIISEEYVWYLRVAGDLVSKATSFAFPDDFRSREWEYVLVDSSLNRKPVGELLTRGSACVVLPVLKQKFTPLDVSWEPSAPALSEA